MKFFEKTVTRPNLSWFDGISSKHRWKRIFIIVIGNVESNTRNKVGIAKQMCEDAIMLSQYSKVVGASTTFPFCLDFVKVNFHYKEKRKENVIIYYYLLLEKENFVT